MYLEEKVQGSNKYFYLVKSIRLGKGKWHKVRIYLGKKKPSKKELEMLNKKYSSKYLSPEQITIIEHIRKKYLEYLSKASMTELENFEEATLTEFTYNTSAIEGSSLSLQETAYILKDNRTPKGKDLREIHGALNMKEAYKFMKSMKDITHENIKKLQEIIMKNIFEVELGQYRTGYIRIIGARHRPVLPLDVKPKMNALLEWYDRNEHKLHPFELACIFHIKFEAIHPFSDGNGRTGRLLSNFILHKHKYPFLDIKVEKRVGYYRTMDLASYSRKIKPFIDYAFETYVDDAEKMGWTEGDPDMMEMLRIELERIRKFLVKL